MEPIFDKNVTAFSSIAMSGNQTSAIINVSEILTLSVHEIWTGTPAGNIIVEAGNDPNGVDFVTLDTQAAGGAAGNHLYQPTKVGFQFLRIRYSFTSSTGSLTVYVACKRG